MKVIAAVQYITWAIGNDNDLICRIDKDMKRFKDLTMTKVVVMGRKTYESLGMPDGLPGRVNIVLTHTPIPSGPDSVISCTYDNLDDILKDYDTNDIFVIGGGDTYKKFLPKCDTAYITKIFRECKYDVAMPNLDLTPGWVITERSEMMEDLDRVSNDKVVYQYLTYQKK